MPRSMNVISPHRMVAEDVMELIIDNACDHSHKHPNLRMLIEEVGELAEAIAGTHEHSIDYELIQIGGIVLHWLINIRKPTGTWR